MILLADTCRICEKNSDDTNAAGILKVHYVVIKKIF